MEKEGWSGVCYFYYKTVENIIHFFNSFVISVVGGLGFAVDGL